MPRYATYGQDDSGAGGLAGVLSNQGQSASPQAQSPAPGGSTASLTPGGATGGGTTPGPQAPRQNPTPPTTGQGDPTVGNQVNSGQVGSVAGTAASMAGDQSGGAGVQAQNVGTGYTNFQSILAANASGADGLADRLNKEAYSKATVGTPTSAWGPGGLDGEGVAKKDGGDELGQLQTQPGLQALLQSQYKNQSYSEGASALDSYLAQSSGGAAFASAQKAYQAQASATPSNPTALQPTGAMPSLRKSIKGASHDGLGGSQTRTAGTIAAWRDNHPEWDPQGKP